MEHDATTHPSLSPPALDRRSLLAAGAALALAAAGRPAAALAQATPVADDPLPSWNDGPARQTILDFVARVTDANGPDFVPPPERIATFDQDGTLWVEQPDYAQLFFVLDQVRALAPEHPGWATTEPFASILAGDMSALDGMGERSIAELIAATHTGMTTETFDQYAIRWLATALHPRFGRLFTECVYQPQLELLAFLRANGFQTWIVSGGGIEFIRQMSERVYGIPPQQVIGTSTQLEFLLRGDDAVLVKTAKLGSNDDGPGKPVNIGLHIGRRPIFAFGNSDGDLQMLQYVHPEADAPARLAMIVHHDDAEREYAYDRDSSVGRLDKALDEAPQRGWVVVSMKDDWGRVFPWEG